MSLDVSLFMPSVYDEDDRGAIFVRRDGATVETTRAEWDRANPGVEPVGPSRRPRREPDPSTPRAPDP